MTRCRRATPRLITNSDSNLGREKAPADCCMAVGDLADEIKYNKRQKRAKKTVQAQARKKKNGNTLYFPVSSQTQRRKDKRAPK